MTKEELQSKIRGVTKRIGEVKATGATEAIERLRILRLALMEQLAMQHDSWTLVNAEGKSEFVDKATFDRRAEAWLARKQAESGDAAV
jgi:hypothetical protein